jgi:hypothetical protein
MKIIAELKEILEASEWRDKDYRTAANIFYKKIVKTLRNNKDNLEDILLKSPRFKGWFLDPKFFKNEEIDVGFIPSTEKGALGYTKKTAVILIPVLIGPFDIKHLETRIMSATVKQAVIHEYIHFLDKNRTDGKSKSIIDQGIEEYVNSPAEFNAYYQDGADRISDIMETAGQIEKRKPGTLNKYLKSFNVFKNRFIGKFHETFIKNMNEKYKKKFDSRLYNLYIGFLDQYGDH